MATCCNLTADELKACGDTALKKGDASQAIKYYTMAINKNGSNHVYYSNRSAAYLTAGNAHSALVDANSCIRLNPEFAKGYSRKGAALHSQKLYTESISAYKEGLAKFPEDEGLKNGLYHVNKKRIEKWEMLNKKYEEKDEVNNQQCKEGPGLWKLTGRKIRQYKVGKIALDGIRDGLAATQKTVQSSLAGAKKALCVHDGKIIVDFKELKVYNPHEKIKGVIKMNLEEPIHAHSLNVTLEATHSVKSESSGTAEEETTFEETYEIRGDQVYPINGEFEFEIIVPRLKKDRRNNSFISTIFHELSEHNKSVAKWGFFATLVSPGGSLINMHSPTYRLHVND